MKQTATRPRTVIDRIWDTHVVVELSGERALLFLCVDPEAGEMIERSERRHRFAIDATQREMLL